jgi:hypothetical protein
MSEKLVTRTHSGVDAYDFRKDMRNLGKNCRVDENHTAAEVEYLIYM